MKGEANFPKSHLSNVPDETDVRTSFRMSAFLEMPLWTQYLYVQPAVSLQGKGAKGLYAFGFAFPLIAIVGVELDDYHQYVLWMEIPLDIVAKAPATDFGLNFLAGYQFSNGLIIHGGYVLGLTDLSASLTSVATGRELSRPTLYGRQV